MQRFSKQCFRSRSISFTFFQFQQVELYTHIMYKKEELEAMEIPQLMGIANELGIKVSQDSAPSTRPLRIVRNLVMMPLRKNAHALPRKIRAKSIQ